MKLPSKDINPEAWSFHYLVFEVDDVDAERERFNRFNPEPIKTEDDGKKVFFVKDTDGLPIEIRD